MYNIVSSLQQQVNRIVSGAGLGAEDTTSIYKVVYLGISDVKLVDTRPFINDVFEYLGMIGIRGLVKNEENIQALIGVVLCKLYLVWYKRDMFRSRIAKILRDVGMGKQAENFKKCGQHVYNLECCQCGYVHNVAFHCKLRVCPECGGVREYEVIKAYRDALLSLGRLRFVTLTLKNVADLKAGVDRIRSCFTKLRHRKFYKSRIKGGLYGIEATVGQDGLWHVHIHFIYAGAWIEQAKLANDWESITGDSRVVWIERVKDVAKGVEYVVKYACKQNDTLLVSSVKLGEYMQVLYKVRLVQAFGSLLGKKADKGLFLCPECGGDIWRIVLVGTGTVVYDELESLRARASPGMPVGLGGNNK